jgi:hypothetical protein
VSAVQGGACPLCNQNPHQGLTETDPGTRTDAADLAAGYGARGGRATMLAVVHCKTGVKYAAQSGRASQQLRQAAHASGMRYPPGNATNQDVLAGIQEHAGNDAVFNQLRQEAQDWHVASRDNEALPIGYPPGACGAQRALVNCLDNGGLPIAMTERWYHPEGQDVSRRIRYIDATSPTGQCIVADDFFAHGDTVPPCATCEVLVPLLLCFQEEDECDHPNPNPAQAAP